MSDKKIIVGFWLRFLSDILDSLILGVFGFILSVIFGHFFYKLGENGLIIGLVITFLYVGIFQSRVGQGQSLAKKMLNIQVVRMDGSFLSLPQSFLRYSIIALLFYNQWIGMLIISLFPGLSNMVFYNFYFLFLLFLIVGTCFLVPFHPLKRGLHDILTDSIVVRKGLHNSLELNGLMVKSKEIKAFIVCTIIFIVLGVFSLFFSTYLGNKAFQELSMPEIIEFKKEIEKNTYLKSVGIMFSGKWNSSETKNKVDLNTKTISISAFLDKNKFDNKKERMTEIQKAVDLLVRKYSKISEYDRIVVFIRTGFHIGIAANYTISDMYLFKNDGKAYVRDSK